MSEQVPAVFVYGLLKPGFPLHEVVEPYVVASMRCRVGGRLFDAGVPAARFGSEGTIDGFLLRLDPSRLQEALDVLDDLEDEGKEYRRVLVTVEAGDGERAAAFAYEYLGSHDGFAEVGSSWPRTGSAGTT